MKSTNEELEFLQQKLKNMLSEMGLTQQKAFDIIYEKEELINDFENFKTVFKKSFLKSFKKEKVGKLRNYINILKSSDEYQNLSRTPTNLSSQFYLKYSPLSEDTEGDSLQEKPQNMKLFADEILQIKNIADLSYKEIADVLSEELEKDISEEALKKAIARGKSKRLEQYYYILKEHCEKYKTCIKYRCIFEADDRILSEAEIKEAQRKGREIARKLKQEMLEKQDEEV
ncbi:Uncharacterised protein [Phocoenobacter uteri]|uniref:Uncharacterized protein n=1 Tax=Phocoenobacter uteri TaxID=146806 RepID=A0A379CA45_9PAST|nr:hypothetical protein [Phocoenobacter uteri]MDG6881112.1 hypothetical protein [Phocoenobacter uteri]SUB59134.1 Uncharacterised protein [Phocoenobacter uteri]